MFNKSYEITLELKEIAHLFTTPKLDPFSEYYKPYTAISGIEFIYYEIHGHANRKPITTTIILPKDQVTPQLKDKTKKAVQNYSRSKIYEVSQDISASWYKGIRMVLSTFIVFFITQMIYYYLDQGFSSLNTFFYAISQGINVLGWVFLWFPLETLIFEMWKHRLERTVYQKIETMEIVIKSSTG